MNSPPNDSIGSVINPRTGELAEVDFF